MVRSEGLFAIEEGLAIGLMASAHTREDAG